MTRHVAPPLVPLEASDPARLEFQWEKFRDIARELPPLFERHYREIAADHDIPLAPDWDAYYAMDLQGILHILTARSAGRLVGYTFCMVGGHQHYVTTRFGAIEMFWLAPRFRKGWAGVRLFTTCLRGLKEREVKVVTVAFKLHFKGARVGKLLARLGFKPVDIVVRRRL
jgi:GNAT superfamily N-acetyltransferase